MLANLLFSAVISSGIEIVTNYHPPIDWDLPRLQVNHKNNPYFGAQGSARAKTDSSKFDVAQQRLTQNEQSNDEWNSNDSNSQNYVCKFRT